MHHRVERLPDPDPDYTRFVRTLRREPTDRLTLIELAIHPSVVDALLDARPAQTGDIRADRREAVQRSVRLQHRLGYDAVKVSAIIPWDVHRLRATGEVAPAGGAREWASQHDGPISTLADVDSFAWPMLSDVDFDPVETAQHVLPDGMALIGFCGGVLEFAMDLLGMEPFLIATRSDPALAARVVERVGQTILRVFEAYCRMDRVCAIWLGDDLGHKHGLLLSPEWIREHLVPWYARFAQLAHAHDRPFLIHTCGQTCDIMPALIDEVGADGKHSFEDAVQPVEQFFDQWHDQIAVLGGIDVDLLSRGSEQDVRSRTHAILEHAAPHGGYAAGSGNSITDYVPPANYLAMIEAVFEFDGRA